MNPKDVIMTTSGNQIISTQRMIQYTKKASPWNPSFKAEKSRISLRNTRVYVQNLLTVSADHIINVCVMIYPRSSPSIIIDAWPSAQQRNNVNEANDEENDPSIEG